MIGNLLLHGFIKHYLIIFFCLSVKYFVALEAVYEKINCIKLMESVMTAQL